MTASQPFDLERVIVMPSAWTCISGRFGVHFFEGDLTVQDMDHLDSEGALWRKRHPGKTVELVIVLPSDARLAPEQRDRMTRMIRRWEKERIASATVILAQGLRGALHRSVLTGMMLLAPAPHPARVFGSIEHAVGYLSPYLAAVLPANLAQHAVLDAVTRSYESFRSR